jgi:hypothetical protein
MRHQLIKEAAPHTPIPLDNAHTFARRKTGNKKFVCQFFGLLIFNPCGVEFFHNHKKPRCRLITGAFVSPLCFPLKIAT